VGNLELSQIQIKVDEEYFDIVPRPNNKERHGIKQSILGDGQLTPIIVNENGIILDGHTRFEICEELRIKPKYIVKKFKTKKEERKFVIMTNIARRHLTKFQKIEMAWEIYENEKEKALVRMSWRADKKFQAQGTRNDDGRIYPSSKTKDGHLAEKGTKVKLPDYLKKQGNSGEIFAKYMDTGHTVIGQVEWLKNNARKSVLQQLREGEISISRAYDYERGLSMFSKFSKLEKTWYKNGKKVFPKLCPECKSDTILVTKKKCHVHKKVCCQVCKWGF